MKTSDLPAFFDVVDGHELVRGVDADEGQTGIADFSDVPSARDWVNSLPSRWGGDARDAPYVAPLAEVVTRIAAISGTPVPELDASEADGAAVTMSEGFDADG